MDDKLVRFEDLHLMPGHKMQLTFDGYVNERDRSTLLGYRHNNSLMVTTPIVNGNPIALKVGASLTLRSFVPHMGCACAFRSEVLHISRAPYPHLHLSLPNEVILGEVRSSARAKVVLQAIVSCGEDNKEYPVLVQDVSLGGVGLVAKMLPVMSGERVIMRAALKVNKVEHVVNIEGIVRSINSQAKSISAGVQFDRLDDKNSLTLYAYVLENLHNTA